MLRFWHYNKIRQFGDRAYVALNYLRFLNHIIVIRTFFRKILNMSIRQCQSCEAPSTPVVRTTIGFASRTTFHCQGCGKRIDVPGFFTAAMLSISAPWPLVLVLMAGKYTFLLPAVGWTALVWLMALYRRAKNPVMSEAEVERWLIRQMLKEAERTTRASQPTPVEAAAPVSSSQIAAPALEAEAASVEAVKSQAAQPSSPCILEPVNSQAATAKPAEQVSAKIRGGAFWPWLGSTVLLVIAAIFVGAIYAVFDQIKHFLVSPALPILVAAYLGWFSSEYFYENTKNLPLVLLGTLLAASAVFLTSWLVWLEIRLDGDLGPIGASVNLFGVWDGLGLILETIASKTSYDGVSGSTLIWWWRAEAITLLLGPLLAAGSERTLKL